MSHLPPHVFDAIVHKALASPIRKDILVALAKKPKYLTELAEEIKRKPQTIDFHLKSLQEIGFVDGEWKEGKKYYSLKDPKILDFVRDKKPLPPGMRPKPPHEIVLEAWKDLAAKLKKIDKKIDELDKKVSRLS